MNSEPTSREFEANQTESKFVPEAEAATVDPETNIETKPEDKINAEYEHLLRDNSPIDAGVEGFIYHLKVNEIDPSLRHLFRSSDSAEENDGAVKVLKVFKPGQVQNEFEWQKRAYDIVQDATRKESVDFIKYAQVPKPIEHRVIKLSEETRSVLESQGAKLPSGEVEIMLMDYIDGNDLQEIFYRWIITHAPEDREYAKVDPDTANFETMHHAVSGILGFKYSLGELTDEEILDRRKKVHSALKRTGFILSPSVVDQIRNTRQLLARNHVHHNDEHERNFMVSGEQVYMIDFSRASSSVPSEELGIQIDRQLADLSPEIMDQEAKAKSNEAMERVKMLASEGELKNKFPSAFMAATRGGVELQRHLIARSLSSASSEAAVDDFFALLVHFKDQGQISPDQAKEISRIMKESLRSPVIKRGRVEGYRMVNPAATRRIESYEELFAA